MQSAVENWGGRVMLKTPVSGVKTEAGRATGIVFPDGTVQDYDAVISTMPLTVLVSRLPHVPESVRCHAAQLTFRNAIIVYLHVNSDSVCDDQWIYVQDSGFHTGRITNFRNWNPDNSTRSPTTILAMEFWCNEDDAMWRDTDQELIQSAIRELVATDLVRDKSLIVDGMVYRIRRCYPVYRRGYQEHLRPIQEYLMSIDGLHVIGRYGAFKYNNQDHSILMGLLAAQNILEGADHDLWSINSDYESYQEDYIVSDTGLVPVSA
jgi:protoporphyrinogen oxidase